MATVVTTPTWTSQTAVIGIQMLALGGRVRGTVNLAGKWGGYITIFVMRSGATALTAGVDVRVRRVHGSGAPFMHGGALAAFTGGKTTAVSGVAAAAGNNAGVTSLTINAAKTYAAGPNGDIMLGVIDDTTTPTLASEILRQVFATSTTVKLLEYPTESAHNSTAHVVADQPDLYEVWVDGGETVEVDIDYATSTTGDSVCVGAYIATQDSLGSV